MEYNIWIFPEFRLSKFVKLVKIINHIQNFEGWLNQTQQNRAELKKTLIVGVKNKKWLSKCVIP